MIVMANKKTYRHGDRASFYLARSTPVEILQWINEQEDLTDAILKAIAFSIKHQVATSPIKKVEPASLDSFLGSEPIYPTDPVQTNKDPDPVDDKVVVEPTFDEPVASEPWAGLGNADEDDLM